MTPPVKEYVLYTQSNVDNYGRSLGYLAKTSAKKKDCHKFNYIYTILVLINVCMNNSKINRNVQRHTVLKKGIVRHIARSAKCKSQGLGKQNGQINPAKIKFAYNKGVVNNYWLGWGERCKVRLQDIIVAFGVEGGGIGAKNVLFFCEVQVFSVLSLGCKNNLHLK